MLVLFLERVVQPFVSVTVPSRIQDVVVEMLVMLAQKAQQAAFASIAFSELRHLSCPPSSYSSSHIPYILNDEQPDVYSRDFRIQSNERTV